MVSESQRDAWYRLTPNKRRLLLSHRPDELEQAETLRAGVLSDLADEFGPQQWDATLAVIAEGEAGGEESRSDDEEAERTFAEVGQELGVCAQRVRQIQARAFEKLRRNPLAFELYAGHSPPRYCPWRWWARQ